MVDEGRFERIYAAHGPGVLRYCTYLVGSRDTAEDAAAEVFARFIERGGRVRDEHVEAWLVRVARNTCVSHLRRIRRSRKLIERLGEQTLVADGWRDPEWWMALEALDEQEQLAVYLRIVADLPFADVARLMRKREGAAKMTYYRAMEKLRRKHESSGTVGIVALSGGADHE